MTITVRRLSVFAATAAIASVVLAACSSSGTTSTTAASLDGTTWCAPDLHTRVAVDRLGKVELKEGKNICMLFTQQSEAYIVKIVWWNVEKELNVEEWAVAAPLNDTQLEYVEAEHPANPEFPGIIGAGTIQLVGDDEMQVTQLGRLVNGVAAGFVTTLERVDALPEIPVPVSYPKL